jgi:hypothetical protein
MDRESPEAPLSVDQHDGVLLAAFADHRDEAAFAAVVRRHAGVVFRVCSFAGTLLTTAAVTLYAAETKRIDNLPQPESLPVIKDLPDPFRKADGSRVQTPAEWPAQREYLTRLVMETKYGVLPPAADVDVSGREEAVEAPAGAEMVLKRVTLRIARRGADPPAAIEVPVMMYLPSREVYGFLGASDKLAVVTHGGGHGLDWPAIGAGAAWMLGVGQKKTEYQVLRWPDQDRIFSWSAPGTDERQRRERKQP